MQCLFNIDLPLTDMVEVFINLLKGFHSTVQILSAHKVHLCRFPPPSSLSSSVIVQPKCCIFLSSICVCLHSWFINKVALNDPKPMGSGQLWRLIEKTQRKHTVCEMCFCLSDLMHDHTHILRESMCELFVCVCFLNTYLERIKL